MKFVKKDYQHNNKQVFFKFTKSMPKNKIKSNTPSEVELLIETLLHSMYEQTKEL